MINSSIRAVNGRIKDCRAAIRQIKFRGPCSEFWRPIFRLWLQVAGGAFGLMLGVICAGALAKLIRSLIS